MTDVWNDLLKQVPQKYDELVQSTPLDKPTSNKHAGKSGIYAFKSGSQVVHIGRTRNLQKRMQQHRAKDHNKASFAFKMARKETGHVASYKKEGSRSDLMKDPDFFAAFSKHVDAVKRMDVHFVEVRSHELQYLVELYSCLKYGLSTDEFETS